VRPPYLISESATHKNRGTGAVGVGLSKIHGYRHAFSLNDPSISFPYKQNEIISTGVLFIVGLVVPAAVTLLVALIFVPGPTVAKSTPKPLIWRRKLWEWNTAWMGLGVALAGTHLVTQGLKDIMGKPRPDLLARCQPNVRDAANYAVGGLGFQFAGAPIVVDWHICQQRDDSILADGFASFPSGHTSFSWAGMTYLTLFLCAKFAITIPYLSPAPRSDCLHRAFGDEISPATNGTPCHNQAAAPPVYLLIFAFIPVAAATFIAGSRWVDYRHGGFDIISGAFIGIVFAFLGFRLYHLPVRRGAGWSWRPRSRHRAFYVGLGIPSYVGGERREGDKFTGSNRGDLESGQVVVEPELEDRARDSITTAAPNNSPNHRTQDIPSGEVSVE